MSHWFTDGQAIDAIPADDRAAQYGDGLFETIAIRNGAARFWPLHVARLQTGCARLGIACPATDELHAALQNAIEQSPVPVEFATAKLVVSAGCGPRGYQRDATTKSLLRVGIFAGHRMAPPLYRDGVEVRICSTRLAIQRQLAGVKSLNRLEQVLARSEWRDTDIAEGLMLDTAGRLICGTMSNMFIATDSGLVTPALTRCGVSGVMRRHLLGLLDSADIACEVRDIRSAELNSVNEIFLSNSQLGVVPIRQCGDRHWDVGPLTRRVQELAAANGVPECAP